MGGLQYLSPRLGGQAVGWSDMMISYFFATFKTNTKLLIRTIFKNSETFSKLQTSACVASASASASASTIFIFRKKKNAGTFNNW